MTNIKSKGSKCEMAVQKYLHSEGFRFRLHDAGLPGSPDLVLKKYNAVIFINNCFWYNHKGCKFGGFPKSNIDYWESKISKNRERDDRSYCKLEALGWRVIVIWECGVSHSANKISEIPKKIKSGENFFEWPGEPPKKSESKE